MELESLPSYLRGLVRHGRRPAVIERGIYRQRVLGYGRLLAAAEAARAEYQRRGLPAGARLLLWGLPGADWTIAFYGAVLGGIVIVPADAAFSADYIERIAHRTEAHLLVADAERRARLGGRLPQLPRLELESMLQLPSALAPLPAGPPPPPDRLLEIVYTSGATADPKGVMITHGNLLANLRPIAQEVEKYRRRARVFLPLRFLQLIPPSHLFGQVMALFVPPLLASAVVFPEAQSAAAWARLAREHRVSAVVAVPQQLQLFSQWALAGLDASAGADAPARRDWVLRRSRGRGWLRRWWMWRRLHRQLGWKMWAFIAGGAALPAEDEELWQALGYAVIQGYGLTETAPAIAITHPFRIRRGAVGRRLAGVEVKIAEGGEILVRGGNVSPGYFRDPAATAAGYTDGWLHTGDLGRLDEQGNLILLGRKKDVIVTAEGLNVYPQDIEQQLDAEPEVQESAVVASAAGGRSQPHAVLTPAPGATAAALGAAVERVNARLETHQRLRGYSVWPGPALPRTPSTHKLKRAAIAAWLAGSPVSEPTAGPGWRGFFLHQLRLPPERLRPEARLSEDLGLSSLDHAELLAWLEEQGYSGVDESELAAISSFGELAAALEQPAAYGHTAADSELAAAAAAAAAGAPRAAAWEGYQYPAWPAAGWLRPLRTAMLYAGIFPALASVARLQIEGREQLRGVNRPVLFISNHQSLLDVPAILRALPARFRSWLAPAMSPDHFRDYFSASASARARWRAGRQFRLTQAFFNASLLSDRIGVQKAIRHFGRLADRGYCPLIFPEGARTRDGRLLPFRGGVGMFIRALRLPVAPIRLDGLFEILPTGAEHARRGRARVRLAAPLALPAGEPAALTAELEAWYRHHMD